MTIKTIKTSAPVSVHPGRHVNAIELDQLIRDCLSQAGFDPTQTLERYQGRWYSDDAADRREAVAETRYRFIQAGLDPALIAAWVRIHRPIGEIQTLLTMVKL